MVSKNKQEGFKFIDLFAGIGGFHIAMENLGGECVFASEMDKEARKTYEHNFKKISPKLFSEGLFNDDIRNIMPSEIPDFDVLCAGFPCQPFSQAGHKRGFDDAHNSERGNLFFNIAEIIKEKQPKAFFLENVRGLVNHDNGKTFKIIRKILEEELEYSVYFKVVKASDYGLPQLRPRIFIIGFRDDSFMRGFNFPNPTPLKFNMSDVWGGECSRKVGFTLRVGGRGSHITDRRNWDSYLVDGEVKKVMPEQAQKMQGFGDDFEFPVSKTQAMKQLGNSVAVDAVQAVGANIIKYMDGLMGIEKKTKNKGEWSEFLVFVKLLLKQKLQLASSDLEPKKDSFKIEKVSTKNLNFDFIICDETTIKSINKTTGKEKLIDISEVLNDEYILELRDKIIEGKGTFEIPHFSLIQNALGFSVVKGGNSNQKSDIVLDIEHSTFKKENEGFGIKSYLGSKPTLLNASGNTNFVFEVVGFDKSKIDEVNSISSRTKLLDRIRFINEFGGRFKFVGPEKEAMGYNLKMVDSNMPDIIGHVLLAFFKDRVSSVSEIVNKLDEEGVLKKEIGYDDLAFLQSKVKKLLVDILLGFFAGSKWDGKYLSNGTIVMKESGDCVAFHVVDVESLKDYLYSSIKLDSPSSTRHRYGSLYIEKNGKLYFKLNLQLRF